MTQAQGVNDRLILKQYVGRLYLVMLILFIMNKFYVRPLVLANDFPQIFQILVLSIPNFFEAIMGTYLLTGILMTIRHVLRDRFNPIHTTYVYVAAVILASIYVISQEFKIHNIGGNNVFDPFDVVASVIGLMVSYLLLRKFGFHEVSNDGV